MVRSEASSPNSLGPERDWPEVRGEECRPRTVLSWLLAKWVVGESEEALGPAAEQKQNETEDSPPGPPPGEGAALFSPSPEKDQTPTSPGCPRQGRFVDFLDDLGPGWAHGDGQTEAWPRGQRWMVHHAGAGCAGSPRSAAVPPRTAGRSPRRCPHTQKHDALCFKNKQI